MKKLILSLFTMFSLLGCNNDRSIYVHYECIRLSEQYYSETLKGLVMDDDFTMTQEALDNGDSFGLFVYQNGCSGCVTMMPRVINVLEKHNVYFLSVSLPSVKQHNATIIDDVVDYTPSVVLFKKGEVFTYLDPTRDEDVSAYSSEKGFEEWVTFFVDM